MLLPCTILVPTWVACHMAVIQKDPPSLKMGSAMSVHLGTGHHLCPVGLTCCEVTID